MFFQAFIGLTAQRTEVEDDKGQQDPHPQMNDSMHTVYGVLRLSGLNFQMFERPVAGRNCHGMTRPAARDLAAKLSGARKQI